MRLIWLIWQVKSGPCWQFMKHEEAGWGILAIEETSPSFKPKHSLGIVTKEQLLHVVAEFEGIKVF
jgi:hypothetical protein